MESDFTVLQRQRQIVYVHDKQKQAEDGSPTVTAIFLNSWMNL